MGKEYVEISAEVVSALQGGISTLDASTGGGNEDYNTFINWDAGGFIGQGFYLEDNLSPLGQWWANNCSGNGTTVQGSYANSAEGIALWITTENVQDLNAALGNWSNEAKTDFLQAHSMIFLNCLD